MENSNEESTPVVGSILVDISKLLGVQVSEDYFNPDIIIHINSALNRLCQIGIGPDTPYKITGTSETWNDFIPGSDYENVKTYIFIYVKLIFDPPTSGFVTEAYKAEKAELEWRMNVQAENAKDDIYCPGIIYNVGDKVVRNGVHYVRIVPQEKPEEWSYRNWKVFAYDDDSVDAYDTTKAYVVGDKCKHEDKYYVCVTNTTAGEFDTTKWVEYNP